MASTRADPARDADLEHRVHFDSLDIERVRALAGVLAGVLMAQRPMTEEQESNSMALASASMAVAVAKAFIRIVLPACWSYIRLSAHWRLRLRIVPAC